MLAPHLNTALPGTIGLGPVRLPVFALFATAGLMAALTLSQRTARRLGLDADRLWDAGIFAVAAAFVASRALLIAQNWKVFRMAPMLVLALPSLTGSGILLTALATLLYLRAKRLPLRRSFDAWAPSMALLTVFLQVGHFFEGTEAGMPTAKPWGILTPGDTVLGRTQPVQLFAATLALLLTLWLYRGAAHTSLRAGALAARAFLFGGLASFLLDMLRQPVAQDASLPLDPSQIAALAAIAAGSLLWLLPGNAPRTLSAASYQETTHSHA
ncbi:MAG: prolipoprotein diacylglyceryl transferase [Acidobacteriaceae bacterium]|nr:prolipoprotein diacylglyceryl transferase [Acidobacteriaceae bacterium]